MSLSGVPARSGPDGLKFDLDGPIVGLSPGRWGQLLHPYFQRDLEAGRITREQVLELLECMRIKFSSIEYVSPRSWASLASLNLFQHLVVGGLKPDGTSAENELEELILESGITMQTTQPTLGVLVDPKLSERFLLKAAECTKAGAGYPAWFNNRAIIEHRRWTGVGNELVLENLCRLLRTEANVVIRVPIVPGCNDDVDNDATMAEFMRGLGLDRVQLLPLHKLGTDKFEQVGRRAGQLESLSPPSAEQLAQLAAVIQQHGILCISQ